MMLDSKPWLAAALLLSGLLTRTAEAGDPVPEHWRTLQNDGFSVRYTAGFEEDARRVEQYLQHAMAAMVREFSDHDVEHLLLTARCEVYLYPQPNDKASEARALAETGVSGGEYFARFHFLTPSAYGDAARTNVGEPKDDHYFFKLAVHEYSTIVLERLTREKRRGWKFFSAPRWFVQGYEEYLALHHSSEHSLSVTLEKYRALLRDRPKRIGFGFGIEVSDAYTDGALLLTFMHDAYGKQKVQAVLLSEEPTFNRALRSCLGDDLAGFAARFADWSNDGDLSAAISRVSVLRPQGRLAVFRPQFAKHVAVFGVEIVATAGTPDQKILHAAHLLAQYLDNDEDGEPDDRRVMGALREHGAFLVMAASESEMEGLDIDWENLERAGFSMGQDLYGEETRPDGPPHRPGPGRFDAALEEVLHLVSFGYAAAYPERFGFEHGSAISAAMDLARGGRFEQIPARYPESAWYHYDDPTCGYGCQVGEYFYWVLTSILGAQQYPGRAREIADEWELTTPEQVRSGDPAAYALMTDPNLRLPKKLPDGSYRR